MTKFRLAHARRLGEAKAKEFELKSFPICPFQIAKQEDIMIQAKEPEATGVSGGIFFHGNEVGIFYATNIDNKGFQRFTIAHELGHYYIDGHPDEIINNGGFHPSRAGFTEGASSIELEADHFASGLLLPSHLVEQHLSEAQRGMAGILSLHDVSICSITACAIRAAECVRYPLAVIVSKDDTVSYSFLSESFKSLDFKGYLRKGATLPNTATRSFNASMTNVQSSHQVCAQTSLSDWFDTRSNVPLDEEIIGLGSYGFTLTVLSSNDLPDDPYEEDYDEEEILIESWTPRFSYKK